MPRAVTDRRSPREAGAWFRWNGYNGHRPITSTAIEKLMPNSRALGIDLGTTNTVTATLDRLGHPQSIVNAEGERLTPSTVHLGTREVIVGRDAVMAHLRGAADVAQLIKRQLGRRVFDRPLLGRHYPPEALQAWILRKVHQDARAQLGLPIDQMRKVVITVPAYFDEVRRKATQDAGYIAGLDVIDIINEPTAAAVAYGYEQGIISQANNKVENLLVYDLGGGTFDVTVMQVRRDEFITLATDGDYQLGGHDWDSRLADHVATEVAQQLGEDPREDPVAAAVLWFRCEQAKRSLSAREQTTIVCQQGDRSLQVDLTRDQFEQMTGDLLERTAFTTRQTLQAAGLDWPQIDRVLLVGGSTRMPAVVELLRQLSGREPQRSIAADEAVAFGAALHADHLMAKHRGDPPRFTICNVNSHSLGVVANDPLTRRQRNAVIIPRNTHLPVSAKRLFQTQRPGQRSVLVQIVEGESADPTQCVPLGRCTLRDLPPELPAQSPIDVLFEYHQDGRLTVQVRITGTDRWVRHRMTRENSLGAAQLETWRQYLADMRDPSAPLPSP